jgi:hypothetical protein
VKWSGGVQYNVGDGLGTTEYTEWQRPLSGIHSIMMEKLAQAGEFGGCRPLPFTLSTIMYKVVVYAPTEGAVLQYSSNTKSWLMTFLFKKASYYLRMPLSTTMRQLPLLTHGPKIGTVNLISPLEMPTIILCLSQGLKHSKKLPYMPCLPFE